MYIESAILTFYVPQANSLKDKRKVCRSLLDKTRQRFNISIAEIATQDIHQQLTIGIATISGTAAHAKNSLNETIRFMETNADAELTSIEID